MQEVPRRCMSEDSGIPAAGRNEIAARTKREYAFRMNEFASRAMRWTICPAVLVDGRV